MVWFNIIPRKDAKNHKILSQLDSIYELLASSNKVNIVMDVQLALNKILREDNLDTDDIQSIIGALVDNTTSKLEEELEENARKVSPYLEKRS